MFHSGYKKCLCSEIRLFITYLTVSIIVSSLNSQDLQKPTPYETQPQKFANNINSSPKKDFKIIASTESFIELEFYPHYSASSKISYNGENLYSINFGQGISKDLRFSGEPDIKSRQFTVIFPTETNNTISVIDYDEKDVTDINLAPVAKFKAEITKDNSLIPEAGFEKDSKYYSQNKFLPEKIALIENIGTVRECIAGNLVIYPYQYNPAERILKQFTRIRVRITFGSPPVKKYTRKSEAEKEILNSLAINSQVGSNWINPALIDYRKGNIIENSVLNSGDWYKVEIKDNGTGGSDGIYKISKNFLQNAGINLNNIDPRTIKMFGNGGYLLPEELYTPRPQDLEEIAIYIEGENDGHFDDNDYILFYGRGINNWNYDTILKTYSHYVNPYSTSNYYWICLNTPGAGKRMISEQSINNNNPLIMNFFTEKFFYEPEVNNLLGQGTIWLSDRKSPGESFLWNNILTGLVANSDILYKIKPASRCFTGYSNYMRIREDNSQVSEINIPMGTIEYGAGNFIWTYPQSFTINQSQLTNGNQSVFRETYYATTSDAEGYLDWMEIQYKRSLNSVNNDFINFNSPDTSADVEYNVSSFSSSQVKVFDASLHNNVKLIQPLSVTANNVRFQKNETRSRLSKYFVTGQNGYKNPTGISQKVSNQNLKGNYNSGASFIIITHPDLLQAANKLKTKRQAREVSNPDYLKTEIFYCDQIYNEFSGGVTEPVAIRDFLKYCYENWQEKPVYVCFLGDGSCDYKNILNTGGNYVPPYEVTDPQLNRLNTYTSDDFFVNVSGENFPDRPDMANGRIPARTLADANNYLDKIDCYENGEYNGYWKNKMVFVADDQMTSSGCEGIPHTAMSEELSESYVPDYIEKTKIYMINYPAVITSQGKRKPGVNADIIKYWNDGCIDIHWIGHGSADVWADEYVLESGVVMGQLNNTCKYPLVTIASCEMAKFDNPTSQSASELFIMTSNKGGIGAFAPSSPVFAFNNAALMEALFNNMYISRDTLLLQKRFGNAVFQTKQNLFGVNEMKYILLADPTIRVQLPRYESKIDSISGLSGDTMKALSRVKIFGSIMHPDSSLWQDYSGKIFLKVFDVDRHFTVTDECNFTNNFTTNGGVIHSGSQNVLNGKFSVEFIVPKDISYLNAPGKIINYFYNNSTDGANSYRNFIVGGINTTAPVDTTGPNLKLYLNTRNFRSGDIVNGNFKLLADLFDESGINTTGTIGHKISAELDNNENLKYDVTPFFNTDTSYKSGSLQYDFTGVPDGNHKLKLTAWDTYNNSAQGEINFNVSSYTVLHITNVYNYPNPFKNNTSFTFQHNYPGNVGVKIKIYTVSGRLIKELEKNNIPDKFVTIDWTGKDSDGENLSNGIYLYKIMVTADDGNSESEIGKLAVLK